jgi:hypothetical protein
MLKLHVHSIATLLLLNDYGDTNVYHVLALKTSQLLFGNDSCHFQTGPRPTFGTTDALFTHRRLNSQNFNKHIPNKNRFHFQKLADLRQ